MEPIQSTTTATSTSWVSQMTAGEFVVIGAAGIAFIAALITASVTAWGYYYTAKKEREIELHKAKSDAYAEFLGNLELLIPDKEGKSLIDNDKIRILNKDLSILLLKTSSSVVLEINKQIFGNDRTAGISLNRKGIKKLQLILHNDINGKLKNASGDLQEGDFPHFPFQ